MNATGREGPRTQRSDALQNRAAVLAAAVVALGRDGYLNMQTLAADAGVSRSTLYRHFPTRDSLEKALREDALVAVASTVEEIVSESRPPLAALRALVGALVELAAERRLDLLGGPLAEEGWEAAIAMRPLIERLMRAAELGPSPSVEWLERTGAHFLGACLRAGAGADPGQGAERLFRAISEPLDQGLIVLDSEGSLVALNSRAARVLDPGGNADVGSQLTEPRLEVIYEDGSGCPAGTYPLSRAVRTKDVQKGVRGHRGDGSITWIEVEAHPLRTPKGEVYAVLGILVDVSAEKDWELERLRPPGQLGGRGPVPLDIARVLDDIPPHLFPEQFISEARRISGTPVALYVLDIDGTHLLRLAGPEEFPDRLDAPLALGPELAEDGIPDLKAQIEAELPGIVVVPMWLRGRAIGLLLGLGAAEEPLLDLARHGAAAMELAGGYTDVIAAAQRRKETHAAAELQQSLIPPRIARMGAGTLAGSVLPSYEVGGDWFDYVENRDGAWLAVADAVGKGATAGAFAAIALAALRAARRGDASLEAAAQTMHEVTYDIGRPEFFVTAIVARWHAVYSTFSWVNCGHPPPLVVHPDDSIEQLFTPPGLPLGLMERERRFSRRQRRLEAGELLILHSDGITGRRTKDGVFGLGGIERAVRSATSRSATAVVRAIQEAVMEAAEEPLQDDAIAIVLDPTSRR